MLFHVKNKARRSIIVNANDQNDAAKIAYDFGLVRDIKNAKVSQPTEHDDFLHKWKRIKIKNLDILDSLRGHAYIDPENPNMIKVKPTLTNVVSEKYLKGKEPKSRFNKPSRLGAFFKKLLNFGR